MSGWLGAERHDLDVCASTSDEAARLARAGCAHGTVVTAVAQRAGRGRQGRAWHSAPGSGVYLSAVLRLPLAAPDVPGVTLAVGIGVCDAARRAGAAAAIKWPNDVVVRMPDGGPPKKLAGVLVETTSQAGRIDAVVVGIGVNLAGELPDELRDRATTLAAAGAPVERAAFTDALLAAVEPWIDRYVAGGVAAIAADWEARCDRGARVRAVADGAAVEGVVDGLEPDGALRLRDDAGRVHRVIAGEIVVVASS